MSKPVVIAGGGKEADQTRDVLERAGWETVCLKPEALPAEVGRVKPILVLLYLPPDPAGRTSAEELTRRLQSTSYGALVPILLFGPEPSPSGVEVHRLGGDLYVSFPASEEAILGAVTRLMGRGAQPGPAADITPGPATDSVQAQPPAQDALDTLLAHDVDLDPLTFARQLAASAPLSEPVSTQPSEPSSDLAAPGLHRRSADLADDAGSRDASEDLLESASLPDLPEPVGRSSLSSPDGPAPLPDLEGLEALGPPPARGGDAPLPEAAPTGNATPPADTALGASREPTQAATTPSASDLGIEALATGSQGDTVAVQIRKTIQSAEERIIGPGTPLQHPEPLASTSSSAPDVPSTTAPGKSPIAPIHLSKLTPPGTGAHDPVGAGAESPLRTEPPGLDLDDIDLDALERDTIAGVEAADPEELIDRLDSGLTERPEPPQGPSLESTPTPSRVGTTVDAKPQAAAVQPSAQTEVGSEADGSANPPFTPPATPLASPYDLPPVVAGGADQAALGEQDLVDTVPGRRTAVIADVVPRPLVERHGDFPGSAPAPPRTRPIPPPPQEGDLSEVVPATLLWRLHCHRFTGTLVVSGHGSELRITLTRGTVRLATSTRPGARMLAMLRRTGLLSQDDVLAVEKDVARTGRRVGAVLLDRGLLKPAELVPTVRDHLSDVLYSLFSLEAGSFALADEQDDNDELVYLDIPTPAILFEGVRRGYSQARIERLAGGSSVTSLRLPSFDETLLAGAPLTGRDWRLIDALDGRTPLATLADRLGLPLHRALAIAWALHAMDQATILPLEPYGREEQHEQLGDPPPSARSIGGTSASAEVAPPSGEPGPASSVDFETDARRISERLSVVREGSYFDCLGLGFDAGPAEVLRAYRQIREQLDPERLHPDVRAQYASELAEILEVLREAYDVLTDPSLRDDYARYVQAGDEEEQLETTPAH